MHYKITLAVQYASDAAEYLMDALGPLEALASTAARKPLDPSSDQSVAATQLQCALVEGQRSLRAAATHLNDCAARPVRPARSEASITTGSRTQ